MGDILKEVEDEDGLAQSRSEIQDVAVVAIGRNEGERLRRCLESIASQAAKVIYVDSGSTDGSVTFVHANGARVVELDRSRPFTAARARIPASMPWAPTARPSASCSLSMGTARSSRAGSPPLEIF